MTNNAALPDDDSWTFKKIIENNQVKWLGEQPSVQTAHVIVTILEEITLPVVKRRTFPTNLVGKVQIFGDIVNPIVDEEDWECLK